MEYVDTTQTIIAALSKLVLTPILKNGGFDNFMEDIFKEHNLMSAVGVGAADYASQYFLDNTLFSQITNLHPSVNMGQSVLTGAIYTAGGYVLEELDLVKGSRAYSYKWFPMNYNYLTEFVYITLLDSLAQVSAPSSLMGGYSNVGRVGTKVYIAPVQNGIPTQAPVQTTVLKKGTKQAHVVHKAPTSLKA